MKRYKILKGKISWGSLIKLASLVGDQLGIIVPCCQWWWSWWRMATWQCWESFPEGHGKWPFPFWLIPACPAKTSWV